MRKLCHSSLKLSTGTPLQIVQSGRKIIIVVILGLICADTNAFSVDKELKPSKEEVKEMVLTPDQMKKYASTYKDPYVLHIRKAINSFLSGKLIGRDSYKDLKAVDQEYLKNKFIVLSVENSLMGGRDISLISQKKSDKIFWAWVYKTEGGYELRAFEVEEHTDEEIKNIRIRAKRFLEDKNLAL
jgi:hypothetical protein